MSSDTRSSRRTALWGLVASLLLWSALPLWSQHGGNGVLSHASTDHLHHPFATWVFFQRGLDVYRLPLGESSKGVETRRPVELWMQMPFNYPPGAFAVFAPLTLLGEAVPMSARSFGGVAIWWTLLLAHLAAAAAWAATSRVEPRWPRWLLRGLAYLLLVEMGLEGFYDSAWLACGFLALRAARDLRPEAVLLWICAAALLHFRAAVLAPLAVWALLEALRGRPLRRWPWPVLAALAATGFVCLGSFALMYPATSGFRHGHASLIEDLGNLRFVRAAVVTAPTFVFVVWTRRWLLLATMATCFAVGLVDVRMWWHASAALVVPLTAALLEGAERRAVVSAVAIGWFAVVQAQLWGWSPLQFARLLAAVRF